MSVTATTEGTKQTIVQLLDDLPLESLTVVERFVKFLREQAKQGEPVVAVPDTESVPYRYPTVPVPPSVFRGLIDLMPPVGGDALADTEAVYDTD